MTSTMPQPLNEHALLTVHKFETHANVDFIDVVFELSEAQTARATEDQMPVHWPRNAFKITTAIEQDQHSKKSAVQRLTIHDPLKHPVKRESIEQFIARVGAARYQRDGRYVFDAAEHGIDFVRDTRSKARSTAEITSEQREAFGDFVHEVLGSLGPSPAGVGRRYMMPGLRTDKARIVGDRRSAIVRAIKGGRSVYMGHCPKKARNEAETNDPTCNARGQMHDREQHRAYFKTLDNGVALPEHQHRFRMEQTALGRACPLDDVLDLLDSDPSTAQHARLNLAKCWYAHHIAPGILGTMQRWALQTTHEMPKETCADARESKSKPALLDAWYAAQLGADNIKIEGAKMELRHIRQAKATAQSGWNKRVYKAFKDMQQVNQD